MPASPCLNLCEMDTDTGFCRGCLRSLDEIVAWAAMDDGARERVLAAVARRRQDAAAAMAREA